MSAAQANREQPSGTPPARERILDAALAAFAERGFDGATTRSIAAAAGVNLGLIPYYFSDKQGLWREAVDRAFAELERGVGDVVHDAHALEDRERLALLIRAYVRFVARNPEFVRLMHEEGKHEGPRMEWLVDRHVRPLYGAIAQLTERARGLGRIPQDVDPLHLHYILAGAVGLIFHQAPECRRLSGKDPMDDAVVEAHADAVVQLLVGPD
jgi:AcrR family transcriptional regulator